VGVLVGLAVGTCVGLVVGADVGLGDKVTFSHAQQTSCEDIPVRGFI